MNLFFRDQFRMEKVWGAWEVPCRSSRRLYVSIARQSIRSVQHVTIQGEIAQDRVLLSCPWGQKEPCEIVFYISKTFHEVQRQPLQEKFTPALHHYTETIHPICPTCHQPGRERPRSRTTVMPMGAKGAVCDCLQDFEGFP